MIDSNSIRSFRKSNGLTQQEFADKCLLSYLTISRAERGECLTENTIIAICRAFGIKPDDIERCTCENISGDVIRNLRKQNGWTQEDLSFESGTSQPLISLYETGKLIPKQKTQRKILKALGVSV